MLTTNTVKDRTGAARRGHRPGAATSQRVNQLKPYADFQQMAETRIQTVKDLAASRFDWEQALRDISRAIPADVTLSTLNGYVSSAAGGGSRHPQRDRRAGDRAQRLHDGQRQVATLLSRLRSVDGVTRVTLTKSTRTDELQAPPLGAAADRRHHRRRRACGTSRPPTFEIVMFFERSEVPSTRRGHHRPAVRPPRRRPPAPAGTTASRPRRVTTPPADPAESGTATPASTPQGGVAQ